MTVTGKPRRPFLNPWRIFGWGLVATLLSLPAILRFPWTPGDFIAMGIMLGTVGLAIEFLVRRSGNAFVRLGAVVGVVTCFLTIWVNLAVGMIGNEDDAYNQLFLIPILVFIGGAFVTRFRPSGMTIVMLIAAAVQFGLALGGIGIDPLGARFTMVFALFWLFGGALFRAGAKR
ncbi:hypothetical protein [Sphingomonas sp. LHG3406-1]|uniref:hypothetical protein n=1 Tax=Sphingomonas sp. LHG3406-1 TaxID=2804617 RepID=UPI00260E6C98|nr:hypothetical protein [Sphingomonas sp. LHG3406-1]